jgi:hypothetical protein
VKIQSYFLDDTRIITPPTPITAIPNKGDQLRLCRSFFVIWTLPISATFSLVKKVNAVKRVSINPKIKIIIPAFFIGSEY